MGQKSNLTTLRKFKKTLNLLSYNSKNFIFIFNFLKYFKFLLSIKGVWVFFETINFIGNKLYLNLVFFYRSFKTTKYKRKGIKRKEKKSELFQLKNTKLVNLFFSQFDLFKNNLIVLSVKNINKELDNSLLNFLFNKFKKFMNILFNRRFNLFIDFLKITTLLCQNKIESEQFLFLLGQIFKALPKRSHSRFLVFLRFLFKTILFDINFSKENNNIKGIKFIINGKLQGKPRASFSCIQEGSTPIQSFNKNISFAKVHVYTLMGAFGLRIWILKK